MFAGERGERLVRVLIILVDHAIGDVNINMEDDERYKDCLAKVHRWSNKLVQSQIEAVHADAPDLADRLVDAHVVHARDVMPPHTMLDGEPTPVEIAKEFLKRMARDPCVQRRIFFNLQGVHRRISCMDAMRDAVYHVARRQAASSAARLVGEFDVVGDDDIKPDDSVSNVGRRLV